MRQMGSRDWEMNNKVVKMVVERHINDEGEVDSRHLHFFPFNSPKHNRLVKLQEASVSNYGGFFAYFSV